MARELKNAHGIADGDDPLGEIREALHRAQEAFHEAAIIGALGNQAAEVRDLCVEAARLLEGSDRITREAHSVLKDTETALNEILRDASYHPYLSKAHHYVHRAAVLAELCEQGKAVTRDTATGSDARSDQIEERAAERRRSRAFARGL